MMLLILSKLCDKRYIQEIAGRGAPPAALFVAMTTTRRKMAHCMDFPRFYRFPALLIGGRSEISLLNAPCRALFTWVVDKIYQCWHRDYVLFTSILMQ